MNQIHSKSILKSRDLDGITGLKKSARYQRMARGEFPKPVSLGGRSVGWRVEDIQKWLDDRPTVDSQAEQQEV